MNSKAYYYVLLLLLVLSGCSLNADQESNLNRAMIEYIDARNNHLINMEVRLTYPDAIRFYKNKGPETFKSRYMPENNQVHLQDGVMKEVVQNGNVIHARFEYIELYESNYEIVQDRRDIYAISFDDGKQWKFIDGDDYNNPNIVSKDKKLIDSE